LSARAPHHISVAVPVPFLDLLTYEVPEGINPPPRGARVDVPLGKRRVTGIVVEERLDVHPDAAGISKIKPINEADAAAFLPAPVVDLALWVAEYYGCGAGDALAAAMPPAREHRTQRIACLTAQGHDESLELKPKQRSAIEILRGAPQGVTVPELNDRGISTAVLQRLAAKGLVTFRRERLERDPFASGVVRVAVRRPDGRTLTEEQSRALEALTAAAAAQKFAVFLLQGVTGSGKTEVYLRLAEKILASGRSVLIMVPEIALTPAVASAFRDAFGDLVAVQHSGLSLGERYDQWQRIRRGASSCL